MGRISSDDCARTGQWVSLRLDSELSELEGRLLDLHLERCDPCKAFAESVTALTASLREAPLEQPAFSATAPTKPPAFSRAPSSPRYRAWAQARRAITAVAAVAVIGVGALVSPNLSATPTAGDDLRTVRNVLGLKERAFEQLEVAAAPASVRRGLIAADQAALGAVATKPPAQGANRLGFRSDG
jgi:predicted anti-sigma-YlaC factor YlaD